jgi:cytochrome c553
MSASLDLAGQGEASSRFVPAATAADGNPQSGEPQAVQQHPEYLVKQLQEFKSASARERHHGCLLRQR